jgi:hypothetical protein
MEAGTLEKKIAKLPDSLKIKAEEYIDALLDEAKSMGMTSEMETLNSRGYGSLKGKIWMSEDFNEQK